jgi:hypothetical protein
MIMPQLSIPLLLCALFLGLCPASRAAPIAFLEDRFDLPPGFRIYRAAGPELTGGSYALAFDGEGRLLVGDGTAIRRLIDKDGDGVFDSFEVMESNYMKATALARLTIVAASEINLEPAGIMMRTRFSAAWTATSIS